MVQVPASSPKIIPIGFIKKFGLNNSQSSLQYRLLSYTLTIMAAVKSIYNLDNVQRGRNNWKLEARQSMIAQ